MKTLTLRLAGPLQSYGNEANYLRRTSSDHPSKSAIVGLVAAALGYHREDPRIQALNALEVAVRIDQPGVPMVDFQTVNWKANKSPKVTYRELLQDAVFVAAIGSEDEQLMATIEYALRHPVFQLYLGRRANVPAWKFQLTPHENKTPFEVLKALDWQAAPWYQKRRHDETVKLELYADADLITDGPAHLVKDVLTSASQRDRRFGYRQVRRTTVAVANPHYVPKTTHDAWQYL